MTPPMIYGDATYFELLAKKFSDFAREMRDMGAVDGALVVEEGEPGDGKARGLYYAKGPYKNES
jgi:hypothetical protein